MRRISYLTLVMIAVAIVVGGVAIGTLYQTAFEVKRADLVQMAQSQARLIESVARIDTRNAKASDISRIRQKTLSQLISDISTYKKFGDTGEYVLGDNDGDEIVFLLPHRHLPSKSSESIPSKSILAEPMRRALTGKSGTIVGLDYRGEMVLAAHEPISDLDIAIVAKIDITEIRAPFIRAGGIAAGIGLLIICIGVILFRFIITPISQRIRESEERHRQIFETAVDAIISIDEYGNIDAFNSAAEKIFGYAATEAIGQNVKLLIPEPHAANHDGYISRYKTTGQKNIIGTGREVTGLRKNGDEFPMSLAVSETQMRGAQHFTGIVRDITDLKQVDRLKSEFVSTVSHELRTPLTSIRGVLGLITGGAFGELSGQLQQMIELAQNNAIRLATLVDDLLDMEKLQSGQIEFKYERISLTDIVTKSVETNQPFAERHKAAFNITHAEPNAFISGDFGRLTQVLSNLLSNAAKFSPEGGNIEISLEPCATGYQVNVSDNGPGIPDEFKDRIFDRFTQVDGSDTRGKGGTGLGLNISKQIIDAHDGTIGLASNPEGGAKFYFTLKEHNEDISHTT